MTRESSESGLSSWYLGYLGTVLRHLHADRRAIAAVTIALAIVGAVAGKMTNNVSSSAQLLLTPLPLRSATTEDDLSRMVAEPMDMKTAALLCMSDAALSRTRDALNADGALDQEVDDLNTLRGSLAYEITVAKETPYETVYSPILRLHAKGSSPQEAKLLVDTWAKTCEELAEEYMQRQHVPAMEAFAARAAAVRTDLETADAALETFRKENNLEHQEERLRALTKLINDTLALRAETVEGQARELAKFESLAAEQTKETPKLQLRWTPSGRLADALGGLLGQSSAAAPGGTQPGMLELEQSNPVYEEVRKEAVLAQSEAAGYGAELSEIDRQLTIFEEELQTLQEAAARIARKDRELERETEVLEEAYLSASIKQTYAEVASGLQRKELHVLSEGAEWRMPRFRRAITFGFTAGIWGLLVGCAVSILLRQIIRPALERTK